MVLIFDTSGVNSINTVMPKSTHRLAQVYTLRWSYSLSIPKRITASDILNVTSGTRIFTV